MYMKKMKKIAGSLALGITFCFLSIFTVSAYTDYFYNQTFNLPSWGGSGASNNFLVPGTNSEYAIVEISRTEGGDSYDTSFQTRYNDNAITIGSAITMTAKGHTGNIIWYPSRATPGGSGISYEKSRTCGGQNTSSNACAIAGNSYRIYLKNGSVLGGTTTVVTKFILKDI